MPEPVTPTELRADLYRIIDQVLETGVPQQIRRGDRMLSLVPDAPPRRLRLDELPRRTAIACSPDELVDQSFADAWNPDL